jgi:hypothetical protein
MTKRADDQNAGRRILSAEDRAHVPGTDAYVSETMKAKAITVSIDMPGGAVSAEFHIDTGRLRILERGLVRVELFPPHSWFAIASVAGNSRWGTRPRERDLRMVVENFIHQHFGISAYQADMARAMACLSPMPQVRSL